MKRVGEVPSLDDLNRWLALAMNIWGIPRPNRIGESDRLMKWVSSLITGWVRSGNSVLKYGLNKKIICVMLERRKRIGQDIIGRKVRILGHCRWIPT